MNGRYSAHAFRRVFGERHGLARLLGRLHEGHHDRLGACIQNALDEDLIVPREAHDRVGRRAAYGAQDVR